MTELTIIVFVRHAHRNASDKDQDNGLDEKGEAQTLDLLNSYSKNQLPESKIFWTSPKKRCVETIEPLSKFSRVPLMVIQELDEQGPSESGKTFENRLHTFIKKTLALSPGPSIYICSHGDVLPLIIDELTGRWVDVKKGQAVVCTRKGRKWEMR